MKLVYPACFYLEEEGLYSVVVPDLNNAATCGSDMADALEMAVDLASGLVLTDYLELGKKPPVATNIKDVSLEYENGFVSNILLDMDTYAEKWGNNAVRKNLTIPAWLNTASEKNNINFSAVLQKALRKELELAE